MFNLSSKTGFNYLVMMNLSTHIAAYINGIFIGYIIYDSSYDFKKIEKIGINYFFEISVTIFYFIFQIIIYLSGEEILIYNATLFALLPIIVPITILYLFNNINMKFDNKFPKIIFKIYKEYSLISFLYRMLIFIYINQLNMNKFHKILIFLIIHPVFCILIRKCLEIKFFNLKKLKNKSI